MTTTRSKKNGETMVDGEVTPPKDELAVAIERDPGGLVIVEPREPRLASIHEALSDVMNEVRSLGKNDRNPQQGFAFRGVDSVLNVVGPAFRSHGVVLVPSVQSVEYTTVEIGQSRRPTGFARAIVKYVLIGPDGSQVEGVSAGEGMDYGDKALPKAMSVALRTFLIQLLCLPTEELHSEPDAEVFERSAPIPAPRRPGGAGPVPAAPLVDQDLLLARQELEAKMREYKLDPGDVLRLYKVDNGAAADPRRETNAQRIRSFTERLAP